MLRFVARVLIARQHDSCRGASDRCNVDLVAVPNAPGLMISNLIAMVVEKGRLLKPHRIAIRENPPYLMAMGFAFSGRFMPAPSRHQVAMSDASPA